MSAKQQMVDITTWYTPVAADKLALASDSKPAIWLKVSPTFPAIPPVAVKSVAVELELIEKLRTKINTPIP